MKFIANLIDLLVSLPWWGALAVLGCLAAFAYFSGVWFKWKMKRIIHEGVLEAGSALKGATATVHSVTAVPAPNGPSPYDLPEDDENFAPELDGTLWDDDGCHFDIITADRRELYQRVYGPTEVEHMATEEECLVRN
jgi:hypothetical protein